MECFGMRLDPVTGDPPPKDRKHINELWDHYETYRMSIGTAEYMLPRTNPFDNWHSSDRYAHESGFNEEYVDKHKAGVKIVRELIDKAILEGRLIL
jgi:hypothetical protein